MTSQSDIIARTGGSLTVVEVKNWAGEIFPSNNKWKVKDSKGNFSERISPLNQVMVQVGAIKKEAKLRSVNGLVCFIGSGKFPQGAPDGIVSPSELVNKLMSLQMGNPNSSYVDSVWESLKRNNSSISESTKASMAQNHKNNIARKYGKKDHANFRYLRWFLLFIAGVLAYAALSA